jgi:hypothetical protein
MPARDDKTSRTIAHLTERQRQLIGRCLKAIVDGPYIEDDAEFQTVMGVTREETASVQAAWPAPDPNGNTDLAVNNTLNNLLGYPHGEWDELSRDADTNPGEVSKVLARWRDVDDIDPSGRGYFDSAL